MEKDTDQKTSQNEEPTQDTTEDNKKDKQDNINKILELIKSSPINLDDKKHDHTHHSEYRDGFAENKKQHKPKNAKVRRLNVSRNSY